jgi:hypothetical protein
MAAWDPLTQPVDYIRLAGQKSPGIAEVISAWDDREFKIHQPPFATGARIVFMRRKLAEFSVRISLYTSEEHAEFAQWRRVIDEKPDARKAAKGLDIWHPLLEAIDIKAVVVRSVSQLEQTEDGVWQCTIAFLEYRPLPQVTLAKMDGTKTGPSDPVDRKIDENTDTINTLVKELAR